MSGRGDEKTRGRVARRATRLGGAEGRGRGGSGGFARGGGGFGGAPLLRGDVAGAGDVYRRLQTLGELPRIHRPALMAIQAVAHLLELIHREDAPCDDGVQGVVRVVPGGGDDGLVVSVHVARAAVEVPERGLHRRVRTRRDALHIHRVRRMSPCATQPAGRIRRDALARPRGEISPRTTPRGSSAPFRRFAREASVQPRLDRSASRDACPPPRRPHARQSEAREAPTRGRLGRADGGTTRCSLAEVGRTILRSDAADAPVRTSLGQRAPRPERHSRRRAGWT